MKSHKISCIVVMAGLSLSCVHQSRTSSVFPTVPTSAVERTSKQAAIERQIVNAKDAGDGDPFVRSLRQKMAAEPENLAVRLELIDHYTRNGYPELALEHCRLAATRFPESAEVALSMAKLLRGMKLTRDAAVGLDAFLAAHPQKSPDYESWLGILRDELGDWPGGEKAHRAALAVNGNLDSLHNNLGYNLLVQGRPQEAAQEFREALKLRPNSEVARNNLGMALAATPQEAVMHWQSVSDPATAHSNMAALLIEQKRYPEARKELDLALGYNKNHPAALSNLRLVSKLDGKPAEIPLKPVQNSRWSRFRSALAKIVGG